MNYQRIYTALMKRARYRDFCYDATERHHELPRCLGGTDHSDNIVRLTTREHFVAHCLLYLIHKKDHPNLVLALPCFFFDKDRRVSLRGKHHYPKWVRRAVHLQQQKIYREFGVLNK